jgi:hypothetical protein
MKRTGLIFAVGVVLVSNGIALIGVARNRAGGPVETIELTERELPLQNTDQENSGVGLRLQWFGQSLPIADIALDQTKLEKVGFDFRIPAGMSGKDLALLPRIAYVALEYGGEVWEQWLQKAENERGQSQSAAQRSGVTGNLERDRMTVSHLVPVDASTSMPDLRRLYPDQSKYLIVRAVLVARLDEVKDPITQTVTSYNCVGYVSEILPSYINVPLPYARLLSPLKPQTGLAPRYTVTLKYGRNLEPWVADVKLH